MSKNYWEDLIMQSWMDLFMIRYISYIPGLCSLAENNNCSRSYPPDGYGSFCIHIPPIVHLAPQFLCWRNLGSGPYLSHVVGFRLILLLSFSSWFSSSHILPSFFAIIQILRNLTYEEQRNLYEQLGEMLGNLCKADKLAACLWKAHNTRQ